MFIMRQDGNRMVNTDNCTNIVIDETDGKFSLIAGTTRHSGQSYVLGTYDTEKDARKVLFNIFDKMSLGENTMLMP